ncbi:hypothetical protein EDB89DRAFT_2068259 [Lactarius sanguifluus]|nr:hypothetical protein EDB89DRAFT_2068259 [Lactarius sanguifluus]
MARKIMGTANYIDKSAAREEHFDSWKVRTFQRVQEDAQKWLSATSAKERKRLYTKTGVRHSVLMELEYWDPTTMVPVDGMHNLFIGLLQYHAQKVLGMDSTRSRNEKATETLRQVENARETLSHASLESLHPRTLTVDVLRILCEERGISVGQSKGLRKRDLIELLKESLSRGETRSASSDIIGEGIIQEIVQGQSAFKTLLEMGISQDDLKAIRDDIAATVRPRWHAAPPANLGQVSHGKLKADEWRSCFEFDILVSLLCIETRRIASGRQTDEYRAKLVHSTFLLATAIRWATSHRTSTKHIEQYTETMKNYLKTLKDLWPNQRFRPNHLNALLIGNYLHLYGPVRGWWMFPFERVIGNLQRSSTNNKLGQMEKTMFAAFCAKSTMHAAIQCLSGLDGWEDSVAITELVIQHRR